MGCARNHDRPHQRCAHIYIVAGIGDHLIIQYAAGPQDHLQADISILILLDRVTHADIAIVATTNS